MGFPGVCVPSPPPDIAASSDGMLPMVVAHLDPAACDYAINLEGGGFVDGAGEEGRIPAVAHLVNHPPEGKRPNVAKLGFTWPEHLRDSSPNRLRGRKPRPGHLLCDVRH